MKIIFLSDLHLTWDKPVARLDDIKTEQFEKLRFVYEYAVKNSRRLILAGDIFNKPRSWFLLPEFISFLKEYYQKVFTYAVFGQHDTYMYNEETRKNTNLGLLEAIEYIQILGSEPIDIGGVDLYGCHYGEKIPDIKNQDALNILSIHANISVKELWDGHEYDYAYSILRKNSFDIILCGDIHRHFFIEANGKHMINTGPMLRLEADVYNFRHKPCFYVYDVKEKTFERIIIPHRPANEVLSRKHIKSKKEAKLMMEDFIEGVKSQKVKHSNIRKWIINFTRKNHKKINKRTRTILSEVMHNGN